MGAGEPAMGQQNLPHLPRQAMVLVTENVCLALLYWGISHINWMLFRSVGVLPMPIWPAAALALVACLLRGWLALPGIALGTALANAISLGAPWGYACSISLMNCLGPLAAASIISARYRRGELSNWDIVLMGSAALLLAPAMTACGGIAFKWGFGLSETLTMSDISMAWLKWFMAHAAGTLLFAPPLLLILREDEP